MEADTVIVAGQAFCSLCGDETPTQAKTASVGQPALVFLAGSPISHPAKTAEGGAATIGDTIELPRFIAPVSERRI